jgi:hypothetical protein
MCRSGPRRSGAPNDTRLTRTGAPSGTSGPHPRQPKQTVVTRRYAYAGGAVVTPAQPCKLRFSGNR